MLAQIYGVIFVFYDVYSKLCAERGESPFNLPVKLKLQKSNSAVAQWQSGSIPRKKTLEGLAKHFGVSVAYLMDLEQKEPPQPETEAVDIDDPIYRELLDRIAKMSPAKKALVLEKVIEIEKF